MPETPEKATAIGQRRYHDYWQKQMADPVFRRVSDEEAAKKERWPQLAERLGVTQAQHPS